jgi:hypothetical protein
MDFDARLGQPFRARRAPGIDPDHVLSAPGEHPRYGLSGTGEADDEKRPFRQGRTV